MESPTLVRKSTRGSGLPPPLAITVVHRLDLPTTLTTSHFLSIQKFIDLQNLIYQMKKKMKFVTSPFHIKFACNGVGCQVITAPASIYNHLYSCTHSVQASPSFFYINISCFIYVCILIPHVYASIYMFKYIYIIYVYGSIINIL